MQLWPTVKNIAKVVRFDISLLERLYSQPDIPGGMVKMMLRRPIPLPKRTQCVSLQGVLRRPIEDQRREQHRGFEWAQGVLVSLAHPRRLRHPNVILASVFIQYSSEEDLGDWSKSNEGQVDVVRQVLKLLSTPKNPTEEEDSKESEAKLKTVTVFSPYTKQVQALCQRLPSSITSSTIDSFQGQESDIIIFSTVRCNVDGDVGFLDDPRRLNVLWTRARPAFIIVGDRVPLGANRLWKRFGSLYGGCHCAGRADYDG